VVILWCGYEGAQLAPQDKHVWHVVTGAQLGAVGLFTALALLALAGNLKATLADQSQASAGNSTK